MVAIYKSHPTVVSFFTVVCDSLPKHSKAETFPTVFNIESIEEDLSAQLRRSEVIKLSFGKAVVQLNPICENHCGIIPLFR